MTEAAFGSAIGHGLSWVIILCDGAKQFAIPGPCPVLSSHGDRASAKSPLETCAQHDRK